MVKIVKLKKIHKNKEYLSRSTLNHSISYMFKSKNIKKKIRDKNPNFLSFKLNNFFIYEVKLYRYYIESFRNINKIKPSQTQIYELNEYLNNLTKNISIENSEKTIYVLPVIRDIFLNMKLNKPILNDIDINIKNIIQNHDNNTNISIKKIKEIYMNKFGKNISSTKIHRILRRKLNYRYLKTAVKTSKLIDKNYKIMSFLFLKIFLRGLKLNANYIFIDEAGFDLINSNFRTWRNKESDIFSKIDKKNRLNLLMAVSKDRIIHYKLTNETTNSNLFLNFMNELYNNLSEEEKTNSIIIMDNLSSHLTKDLYNFYFEKKLKILFNVPYLSKFNMIEICFRALKNITYKSIYKNDSALKKGLNDLVKGNYLKNLLNKFYRETLNNYLNYINDNIKFNLN